MMTTKPVPTLTLARRDRSPPVLNAAGAFLGTQARLLVLAFATGLLGAAEPATAPMLRIEAGTHAAMIRRISADAAGRLVLTVSDDKTARLWELPSGRLLRVLRPPIGEGNEGKLYAGALSPDGTLAAVGGWTGYEWDKTRSLYLFDTATGRLVRRLKGLPISVFDIAFSARGRFLAVVLGTGQGLRIWETATGKEVGRDADYGKNDIYGVDWYGDDRVVTTCYDGQLRLYQLAAGTGGWRLRLLKKSAVKGGKEPYSARFSPDGRKIAVGFSDSTAAAVVDGSDLSFKFAPDTSGVSNGSLVAITWTDDGETLAAAGGWLDGDHVFVRSWPKSGRGKPWDTVATLDSIIDLRPLPGGRILFGALDPAWGVLGAGGPRKLLGAPPQADYRDDDTISHFRLSGDGATAVFGYQQYGKVPARFSVAGRQLILLDEGSPTPGFRAPGLEGLKVIDWKNTTTPKLAGQPLALEPHEISRSLAIAHEASSFLLGADWWLRSYTAKGKERWKVPAPGAAWAVNFAAEDRLAVAAYSDGTIRWHQVDTGRELLAFFPHADRKRWVLWTPQGYYDCSPGAEELIGWHVNRGKDQAADFFPAAKFREQFYRPDVIARVLETRDVAVALKTANAEAGRKVQAAPRIEDVVTKMQPPVVELAVGGARGEVSVPGGAYTFAVRYRVRRGGAEAVTRVRLLVNGRPVETDAPIPASDTAEATASGALPALDCVVTVLAENRFAVSEPATLRLVRISPPAAEPAQLKPKLYLLAAGITIYKNNDQLDNLHFAAKDAQDFAAAFRRQEGGLYQKVEAKVLTDKEATAADIRDGLDWIKQQTTAKDVAVIFFSGHGENDEELRYFFRAHDYDKSRRLRTGVSISDIQATLRSIPGKVLFFIDSCHAGNALGKLFGAKSGSSGVDVTRVVNELSGAENGAIVFTSSTGRQLSLELSEEGNGAFTKAIVEGLDGKADLLRKGTITVSSLEAFVAERVKELTEGQQSPTVAKPQTVPDFPIAVRR